MTRQRLIGVFGLLGLGAVMVVMPWLLIWAATHVTLRFNLRTIDGIWAALTNPDDGTLLLWLIIVIGTVAWAILAVAIVVEIISRLRHVSVPQLRGFGLPQTIAHALVAAAIGVALASNNGATALQATAAPGPVPVDTSGTSIPGHGVPQVQPRAVEDTKDVYVVKKGDTLWDIADAKLGNPRDYPKIFKASRHTVQPGGRHLVDPDLIYPGWKLTVPDDEPKKPAPSKRTEPTGPEATDHAPTKPTPAPATPAVPSSSASATPSVAAADTASQNVETLDDTDESVPLPWMLGGLAGAGALLAGGLWLGLRRRRAVQFRFRRPGRTIPVAEPALAVVEKTLMHQGDLTSDLVAGIAETTQRLAAQLLATSQPIARLLGVDVTHEDLTFRFTEPTDLPEPWQPGADRRQWWVPTDTEPELIGPWDEENEPVWPTLVTLGQDERGWHMINLETLGVVSLTGDRANAEDLVRSWLTELAVVPWARDVEIARGGLFGELATLAAHRSSRSQGADIVGGLLEAATTHDDSLAAESLPTIDAARAAQAGAELWVPRIAVLADDQDGLDALIDLVETRPGRTGVTVIRIGADDSATTATEIRLTPSGRVQVPALGWDLVPSGITRDEAAGCAAVMEAADTVEEDAAVPDLTEQSADWEQHCDAAGHLHVDLTIPRATILRPVDATSLLPDPDVVYVTQTANTPEDLAELAPLVPPATTTLVQESDPTLDQDVADWRADSTDRPRLSVLGPVRLRLGSGGAPTAGLKRVPYYTEIVAYLATRPHGATAEELAEALGIGEERVRRDLTIVRARLGTNPRTRGPYLPEANENSEARQRGVGVYLIEDVLCDANLFRRLRLRGEAAGSAGIDDLATALQLVNGMPYEQLRSRGGLWLGHTHDNHHLVVGIVDVAHILTTRALAAGEVTRARAATEIAQAIAPDDPTPHLDLARIADHEGRPAEAARIAREVTEWSDHSGYGPIDTSERTNAILRAHKWLEHRDRVG
ncbi:MAG: LysM peptidoglycan-binding domain-containing protein [Propionibacteriaceae bacterium]|nr:LysM peptidoglycan-binding domain-containing protein [Propionibacteriaceae bacterium]